MTGAASSLAWNSLEDVPSEGWSIDIIASGSSHVSTSIASFDRGVDVEQWKEKTLAHLCEEFDKGPGKMLVQIKKVSVSLMPLSYADTGGWAHGYEINHVSTKTEHIERFTIHRREHLEEVIMHAGSYEGTWKK